MNLLDNPIWHALRTDHADLALGDDRARRYPPHIGPLSGVREDSAECYETLLPLARPDGVVVVFSLDAPNVMPGWAMLRTGPLYQMLRTARGALQSTPPASLDLRKLTAADAPAMVALAEATEPGPFRLRTLELGTFYGIFHEDHLVSMAGKRMHLPGYVEVSGVCTYPEARGRGYARLLMSLAIDEIEQDGKIAFLHVVTENPAIPLYQSLGFSIRQTFHFAALKHQDCASIEPSNQRVH